MIWLEKHHNGQSMLDDYLSRMDSHYHAFAMTISGIDEVQRFMQTAGLGKTNEDEFSAAIGAVFNRLVEAEWLGFNDNGVRYVGSGGNGMQERKHGHPWVGEVPRDRRFDLKPDFFTAKVREVAGDWAPVSLSTMMHGLDPMEEQQQQVRRSERIAVRTGISGVSSFPAVLTNTSNRFTWDDPRTLWEIKSSADAINATHVLSNLILKATETLRFQWHRHFVLVFLICGTTLRMVHCERSCILMGEPVDFSDDAGVLVKCLIAGFVMSGSVDVGLLIDDRTIEMVDVDGRPRVVVEVDGQEFILGEQIIGPQQDHLAGRATTVHLARRKTGDTDWKYCFKCAWPYAARPHEGVILQDLQDIAGVVRMLAWDAPSVLGMWSLTPERITRDFQLQEATTSGQATPLEKLSLSASSVSQGKMPMRVEDKGACDEDDVSGFHPRQFRRTVTMYIKDSFVTAPLTTLELLEAWRELYLVTNSVASKGWVHRDLSWTNVRLHRLPSSSSWSPTLIDFDLASRIVGPTSGTPDKTGTATFMSIEILTSSRDYQYPLRHQELHEDEVVFWIGFFAIISRAPSGVAKLKELQDPTLTLKQLGYLKAALFMGAASRMNRWFEEMEAREGTVLKALCTRITNILFPNLEVFPDAEEVDEAGARKHLVVHERVVGGIIGELDKSIEELRILLHL
jgi:hypothetical protein